MFIIKRKIKDYLEMMYELQKCDQKLIYVLKKVFVRCNPKFEFVSQFNICQ